MAGMEVRVTDEHLWHLANFTIDFSWEAIAIRVLQLRQGEIKAIKEEHRHDLDMITIQMWSRWKTCFVDDATYSHLIERAESHGYKELAREVRSLLLGPTAQSPQHIKEPQGAPTSPPPPSDIPPLFPELKTENLSPGQRQSLEARLVAETENMRSKFTVLLGKTSYSLEERNIKAEQLMLIFNRHYKGLYRKLKKKYSVAKVFTKADDYWSFFDYEVLAIIISVHGSDDDKENLDKYVVELKEYCKRRICEVPLGVLKKNSDKNREMYVKVDRSFDNDMKKLKKLEYRLSHILDCRLHLVNIKRGCIELTFVCAYEFEDIFPLSTNQRNELDNCDVLKLHSENAVYYENEIGIHPVQSPLDDTFPKYQYSYSLDFPLRFDELQLNLSKILMAITQENIPMKIANYIRGLSTRNYYQSLLSTLEAISFSNQHHLLMPELKKYINLFEYSLLKEIAKVCVDGGAKGDILGEIESFESKVDAFRSSISVANYLRCLEGEHDKVPEDYEELTVKMDLSPADCTLDDLEEHRKELCHQLEKRMDPHLIEPATIFHRVDTEARGISVTWILPPEVASDLKVKIRDDDNVNFFESKKITSLSIDGRCLYTYSHTQGRGSLSTSSNSTSGIFMVRSNSGGSQKSGDGMGVFILAIGRKGSTNSSVTAPSQLSVSDIKLEFDNHSSNTATNGQYPSICMNKKRWIVQVYHHETVVLLRLRYRIGYLDGKKIMWSERYMTYNRGFYPRIAINASGMIVVVYASQVGRLLYYRVGKLVYEKNNTGSNTSPSQGELNNAYIYWHREKVQFAEGRNPSVSLSDSGTVAIVYECGYMVFETFYRLGDIMEDIGDLEWRSEAHPLIQSQSSKHVTIAINDRGQVAVGFASGHEIAIHYKGGEISRETENADTIVLHNDIFTPAPGQNYQPFISLNNHGHVVAVHHSLQGRLNLKTNYGIMALDEGTGLTRIEWATPICARDLSNNGIYASVAINDHMEIVTSHKSLTLNIHKSMRNYVGSLSYV